MGISADVKLFNARIQLGVDQLKKMKGVSKDVIVLGYCFGGTGAVEYARTGAKVKGVISFHGGLASRNVKDGSKIKAAVLALHGANDPYVPANDLAAFKKEMLDNKVNFEMVEYANAVHSFSEKGAGNDNSEGAAYNALADQRSFARAVQFIQE